MLDDIFDHVVIDDPFLLLEAVHQTLLTDTVDHTGDPRCYLENFIQRFVAKDIPLTAGIQKVRMDILFCFSAVQVRKDTVDIDPLPYGGITLQAQLVVPKLRLSAKDKRHRAHGIKAVVQEKAEFFQHLLLKEMRFIQDAYNVPALDTADDLDLLLELTLRVAPVKAGFQPQLVKTALIEPARCKL